LRRILDRLPWLPERVILSGIGEPLVSPHFFSLVDILAERGIKCVFFTNGTLLTPRMREAILSRRNIDAISISCDGAQKTTFENLRVGANFESWKDSVRQFLDEVNKQYQLSLCITASIVISKQNLKEIKEIIALAADLGFDRVNIMEPVPVDDIGAALCPTQAEMSTLPQEDLFEMATGLGLEISCAFRRAELPPKAMIRCIQPWEYVFIHSNGDIAPCCALFGSEKGAVMGNILQEDFSEIWRGDRFCEFRRTSALGANSLCRICPYY
jgi:radical SAM protein with 4Fe4S-binding SPASM domain